MHCLEAAGILNSTYLYTPVPIGVIAGTIGGSRGVQ